MANKHNNSATIYIVTAIILGIITYIEFGLIQYKWLHNHNSTLIVLILLSLSKFLMVLAVFMHLKDDSKTFSGFFAAGMTFALATFIAMVSLFSLRNTAISTVRADRENSETLKEASLQIPENHVLVVEKPKAESKEYQINPAAFDPKTKPAGIVIINIRVAGSDWQELGKKVYQNCSSCHQASGNGIPGAFPPLNVNAAKHYNHDRNYLPTVVSFGLNGKIEIDGTEYNGVMPSWQQLKDEEIAAVLNYILNSWDNTETVKGFKAYSADEIAAIRAKKLSPEEVYRLRAE